MTTGAPVILIVDDDAQLRSMLAELLHLEHYTVLTAKDGEEALSLSQSETIDLWILDVMMPRKSGFETLQELRLKSACPVIMLTARGEPDDRITGLEYGADDYIAKPFSPRELLLRVKAILKRSQRVNEDSGETLKQGLLVLNPSRMNVIYDESEILLTGAEIKILEALLRSPGEAVSRESLNTYALGRELTPYDRALDTHISNLRGKLKKAASDAVVIRSVRGEGYLLVVD
ncbi:MAG: response regulator [Gammaproteobacteria bacterium]